MSIEAMKLALEALTHLQPTALTSFYTIGDRDKAITALRQAIYEIESYRSAYPDNYLQPLTDDDKWKLWVDARSNVLQFARAIEAAHGIKGET